jgi:hypothetical protein
VTVAAEATAVLGSLVHLGESADGAGASSLHSAAFAALVMLLDAAREDGVPVDTDALGFMAGSFE